jgi:hypothetical protein
MRTTFEARTDLTTEQTAHELEEHAAAGHLFHGTPFFTLDGGELRPHVPTGLAVNNRTDEERHPEEGVYLYGGPQGPTRAFMIGHRKIAQLFGFHRTLASDLLIDEETRQPILDENGNPHFDFYASLRYKQAMEGRIGVMPDRRLLPPKDRAAIGGLAMSILVINPNEDPAPYFKAEEFEYVLPRVVSRDEIVKAYTVGAGVFNILNDTSFPNLSDPNTVPRFVGYFDRGGVLAVTPPLAASV